MVKCAIKNHHSRNSIKEFTLKSVCEASSVYMCSENRLMYDTSIMSIYDTEQLLKCINKSYVCHEADVEMIGIMLYCLGLLQMIMRDCLSLAIIYALMMCDSCLQAIKELLAKIHTVSNLFDYQSSEKQFGRILIVIVLAEMKSTYL